MNNVYFRTAISPYEIVQPLEIYYLDKPTKGADQIFEQNGLQIFDLHCAPSLGCFEINIDGNFFRLDWNIPRSTQPAPTNLDGPFFPSIDYTHADIIEILKTITVIPTQPGLHVNQELHLSFNYPVEWGNVTVHQSDTAQQALAVDNHIFLAANDPNGESVGRGGYWGDLLGIDLYNENGIRQYCDGKSNCELFMNDHGVVFVKHKEIVDQMQGNDVPTTQYYFYNPISNFSGIALSSVRLINEETDVVEAEQLIAELVDSINFVE